MSAPIRQFRLTLQLDADTREDLVHRLMDFARDIDMDNVSRGAWGSASTGATYELRIDPTMTHDRYIEELNKYLDKEP